MLGVIGLGALWFAVAGPYARLMNPSFRGVTIAGSVLVAAMGLALMIRPRRGAGASALLVLVLLLAVVAIGRPFAPGVSPLLEASARPAAVLREGYEPLEIDTIFEGLDEEADVEPGTYVAGGVVYRTAAMDAEGVFILIEPLMACCVADAVGFGLRVKAKTLPDKESWVYVYGTLALPPAPVVTPRFRMGTIVFTTVSRRYELSADDIASFQSLLADVTEQIPSERCGIFRKALAKTGLAETLRGEGPYTVFAPLDPGLATLPAEGEPLEARLGDFIVRGHYSKKSLYDVDELTTLSGRTLRVTVVNGTLHIAGARILFGDQLSRNGVVHVVHPAWSRK